MAASDIEVCIIWCMMGFSIEWSCGEEMNTPKFWILSRLSFHMRCRPPVQQARREMPKLSAGVCHTARLRLLFSVSLLTLKPGRLGRLWHRRASLKCRMRCSTCDFQWATFTRCRFALLTLTGIPRSPGLLSRVAGIPSTHAASVDMSYKPSRLSPT